jgi:transcriptional regulator with XRE-family HTH domain
LINNDNFRVTVTICIYNGFYLYIEKTQRRGVKVDLSWVKRAKKLMAEQGFSQSDLVPVLGFKTRGGIGHLFTGRNEISVSQLNKIADFLNVTPQYLTYGGELNRNVDARLLTECSDVVRNLNMEYDLELSEAQQVQLVIYVYNTAQKEEGVEMISKKQIVESAHLLTSLA